MLTKESRSRIVAKFQEKIRIHDLPVSYLLLNTIILTDSDWDQIHKIQEMIDSITEVAALCGLEPTRDGWHWDLPSQWTVNNSTYRAKSVGPEHIEGLPKSRFHGYGQFSRMPGQDRDAEDDQSWWTINVEEL